MTTLQNLGLGKKLDALSLRVTEIQTALAEMRRDVKLILYLLQNPRQEARQSEPPEDSRNAASG